MAQVGEELPAPLVVALQRLVGGAQFGRACLDGILQAAAGRIRRAAVFLEFGGHGVEMLGDPVEFVPRTGFHAVVQRTGLQRARARQQAVQGALQAARQLLRQHDGGGQRQEGHAHGLRAQLPQAALRIGAGDRHGAALARDGAAQQLAQVAAVGHVEHLVQLLPDGRELRPRLQRLQAHQPGLHGRDVVVEKPRCGAELAHLGRYRDPLVLGHLGPQGAVALRQLPQLRGVPAHAGQQGVAHLHRGIHVHEPLRSPDPQPLLVGRQFVQLGEDVARQAAVLGEVIDAVRAPIDEGRLRAHQRDQGGESQGQAQSEHGAGLAVRLAQRARPGAAAPPGAPVSQPDRCSCAIRLSAVIQALSAFRQGM